MDQNKISVITVSNYDEMSQKAAELVIKQIKEKPNSILGLATGSTPIGLYQKLIKYYQEGKVDFSRITTCNLDEYYPIEKEYEQSYWYFMHNNLFHHLNISDDQKHLLNGETDDMEKECREYEEKIQKIGGIDLQILGIGKNGHIAFNEPGTSFDSRTHLVSLAQDTIDANSRFFESKEEVPKKALTMGLATIFEAKKIILLACGENKAEAIKLALEQPISEKLPASLLQKHSDCIFVIDREAASLLKK